MFYASGVSVSLSSSNGNDVYQKESGGSNHFPISEYVKKDNDSCLHNENEVQVVVSSINSNLDYQLHRNDEHYLFRAIYANKNPSVYITSSYGSNYSNTAMIGSSSISNSNNLQQNDEMNIASLQSYPTESIGKDGSKSSNENGSSSLSPNNIIESASKTFMSGISELTMYKLMQQQSSVDYLDRYAGNQSYSMELNDSKVNSYWSYWMANNNSINPSSHLQPSSSQINQPSFNTYYSQDSIQSYTTPVIQSTPISSFNICHSKQFSAFHSVPLLIENNASQVRNVNSILSNQSQIDETVSLIQNPLQSGVNDQFSEHHHYQHENEDLLETNQNDSFLSQQIPVVKNELDENQFISFEESFDSNDHELRNNPMNYQKHKTKNNCSTSKNKPLNQYALALMEQWYVDHLEHPYPSFSVKNELSKMGNITVTQVGTVFVFFIGYYFLFGKNQSL